MASSAAEWTAKFLELSISEDKANQYAAKFHSEQLNISQLVQLNQQALQELGVESFGDRLRIDKAVEELKATTTNNNQNVNQAGIKAKSVDLMTLLKHQLKIIHEHLCHLVDKLEVHHTYVLQHQPPNLQI